MILPWKINTILLLCEIIFIFIFNILKWTKKFSKFIIYEVTYTICASKSINNLKVSQRCVQSVIEILETKSDGWIHKIIHLEVM